MLSLAYFFCWYGGSLLNSHNFCEQRRKRDKREVRAERKGSRSTKNINACTHNIVQAVPALKYQRGYTIGDFPSCDPQMFFKYVT